jgi:hypothetical protein
MINSNNEKFSIVLNRNPFSQKEHIILSPSFDFLEEKEKVECKVCVNNDSLIVFWENMANSLRV